jgi:hypothetical protein
MYRYFFLLKSLAPGSNPTSRKIGSPGPNLSLFVRIGSRSSYHQVKIEIKTLISTVFLLLYDVNVPSKSNEQKNSEEKIFFFDILKVTDENRRIRIRNQRYGSADLDPYQNVTDSQHG